MKAGLLIGAAGALALGACGPADNAEAPVNGEPTQPVTGPRTGATAPSAVTVNTPQQFVDAVSASDSYEIQAAEFAQQFGSSQEVQDFAEMMIQDHTASLDNLRTAAGEADPALTVAPTVNLNARQQSRLEELRETGEAGEGFDEEYIEQQVDAHEDALKILRDYAEAEDAGPLRDFASTTATTVEGHLERARELDER